jgi:hypothetical protein
MRRAFAIVVVVVVLAVTIAVFAQEVPSITRATWGKAVGFPVGPGPEGFAPGMTIGAENLSAFEAIVPAPVATLVRAHGLVLKTRATAPYVPSDGYIVATNAGRGKTRLVETGDDWKTKGIEGYAGGMPFPAPTTGTEIAWNAILSYSGDDGEAEFTVYWIDAKRGVERTEAWRTTSMRAQHRVDLPPLPRVEALAADDVVAATLTQATAPMDKRGYASLYFGYHSLREPDGWIYLPQQRRTIKFAFGLKGESWNSTDLFYEDVRGYTGRPEWMRWKLVEKTTALLPIHAGVPLGEDAAAQAFDFDKPPHWNPRLLWELRPVYVVEATPKVPGYPYSRMLFWVDAESSHILVKSAFDRKGAPWKVLIHALNTSPDPRKKPPIVAAALVVDLQSRHATAFHWRKEAANSGVDPELFRLTTLRKLGR